MNPNQVPQVGSTGSAPVPPAPPNQNEAITDIPEEGFGFADEPVQLPAQPVAPAQQLSPIATPPQPVAPTATPPIPADVMPPSQVPAVPTMPTPTPAPVAQPQPVTIPVPPQPIVPPPAPAAAAPTQPTPLNPLQAQPIDPRISVRPPAPPSPAPGVPTASAATYSPQSVTHLPTDLADRISEKPMQNSNDVLRQVKHGLEGNRLKSILSFILFTVAIFVAAFLINQFIFQSYYVEGTSMTPTLQNNDRLIISKVERTWASVQGKPYIPERGQIVVLDSSIVGLNGQHEQLIKRIIGVPGDHIHIEAGTVTITNGEHPDGYDVTKALGLTNLQATYAEDIIDVDVPDGHVFVMGDNREQGGSYDSRAFGPIEGNKIQGRLWGRILPLDKAQLY